MVIGIIIFAKIITFFYLFTIDLWIDKLLDGFVSGHVIIGILFAIIVIIIGLKIGYYVICRVMLSNF